MPLVNFHTKKSKTEIKNINTKSSKIPSEAKVHAFDVDHNVHHGTPHIHLNNGTVLNIFNGKIFRKKKPVGVMNKKELDVIRASVIEHIISVAEGKFNLDGSMVFVHIDKADPQPTNVHIHSDNKTFSSDNKIYDVGSANKKLKEFHKKLDNHKDFKSILNNLQQLYKLSLNNSVISESLRNKLRILVKSSNISREYLKDKFGVDFESHDVDYY